MHDHSPASDGVILLVEDQDLILDILKQELEDECFCVLAAASAQEACDLIDRYGGAISAACLDIDLGAGDNGFCVARYARAVQAQIKVIYTSGGARTELANERVPGSIFVAKPYLPSEMGALIKTMLGRSTH